MVGHAQQGALHFVGIGGAGMSSLAHYALDVGYAVSGSDVRAGLRTQALTGRGARVSLGHDPAHLEGARCVVVSSAVPPDNVEVAAARAQGLEVLKRGELLARWVNNHRQGVVVCGTHGKGTTAAALTAMLRAQGRRVGAILGARPKGEARAAWGHPEDDVLVAEVDESDRTHLAHHPAFLLLTNLEVDHLHTYGSLEALVQDFAVLIGEHHHTACEKRGQGACVVGHYGDGIAPLLARLAHVPLVRCALDEDASDVRVEHVSAGAEGVTMRVQLPNGTCVSMRSPLRGMLNARNLLAAVTMAHALGVSVAAMQTGAAAFAGLVDRFDSFSALSRRVITDYTSHPTSIRGNLEALRAQGPRRLHAVFQPFRYSLLSHFWDDYLDALRLADHVHVLAMDGAGEAPVDGIRCDVLTARLCERGVAAVRYDDLVALEAGLATQVDVNDTVIIFGGGPLFDLARRLPDRWSDVGRS